MKLKLFFFACMFLFSSAIFANDCAEQILLNKKHCVAFEKNEKIYLHPEVIFPSEKGYYIAINPEEGIVTPFIHADKEGYFIKYKKVRRKYKKKKKPLLRNISTEILEPEKEDEASSQEEPEGRIVADIDETDSDPEETSSEEDVKNDLL